MNDHVSNEADIEKTVIDANYVLFILSTVMLTIVNSLLWILLPDGEQRASLLVINTCLSVFLLADAFVRLWRRKDRLRYLTRGRGWLVFVGSLPIPFAGLARLIYLSLTMGRLRRKELAEARHVVVTKRAQTTLLSMVFASIVVYEIAVLMIIGQESRSPDANIQSANDALWWGYVTISTVGYGDRYPVTTGGRVIGVALMTVGVGLFTGITSFMADWFRRPRSARKYGDAGAAAKPDNVQALLADMRQSLTDQDHAHQENMARLQAQLDEIETKLGTQDN